MKRGLSDVRTLSERDVVRRIEMYRRFLSDWPALIESFERDLESVRAQKSEAGPDFARRHTEGAES